MAVLVSTDMPTITLAGFSLSESDLDGVEWWVSSLEGWDSADVRIETPPRPDSHGAFDTDAWYTERKVTVEGQIIAPTVATRRAAEQALSTLTARLQSVLLRVDEAPYARQMTVKRAGRLQLTQIGATCHYSLPLVAADPRRYDVNQQSATTGLPADGIGFSFPFSFPFSFGSAGAGGTVSVTNAGDLETWPVLTITGPVLNPVVRNNTTGDEMRFTIDLPAGEFLTVDTLNRTVLLDGTANRRNTVAMGSRWPAIVPGVNEFLFRATSSTTDASLVIRYRSAWA